MAARSLVAVVLAAASFAASAAADWLVYTGGGVEEVRGGWQVRRGQVVFTSPSGALMSVKVDEVDLAASAFLTWQVGERRGVSAKHPPAGTEMRVGGAASAGAKEAPCAAAKVVSVVEAVTLEIERGGRREIVHLACVDAPGITHRFPQLSALGADARERVELLARPGFEVCVGDEVPALVDREGHRVVYVRLPDGRDLGGELLARGLALARSGGCAREAVYVKLESQAIAALAGHWDDSRDELASVVANESSGSFSLKAPPQRRIRRG
jgi:endonuclease YncB( thermonuclease family)